MTVNYKFDKSDLTDYLTRSLKRNRTLKASIIVFNLLIILAVPLILIGIFTKSIWWFLLGVSQIGLNAYRPDLRKEAVKKVNELEKNNKLKDCFGSITLTVAADGLILKNVNGEERIPSDHLIDVRMDKKYLTIVLSHGQVFIPADQLPSSKDIQRLFNEIEKIRPPSKVMYLNPYV